MLFFSRSLCFPRQEAYGKTIVESMACGVPSVCFGSTGSAEIIDHLSTGYVAKSGIPRILRLVLTGYFRDLLLTLIQFGNGVLILQASNLILLMLHLNIKSCIMNFSTIKPLGEISFIA